MDIRDTISVELPPRRDDEPASLRRDIVDELSDHLACAYNRELLRGLGTNDAEQRVQERFGDPAAVARRLWLDAMRGKIMVQRVLVATCLCVTAASLLLAGMMWQRAISAQQISDLQAAKAQAIQQEMLQQLREVSGAIQTTRSLDWNPVVFTLTEESPDGPPAVGFSVTFSETAIAEYGPFGKNRRSGFATPGLMGQGVSKSTTLESGNSGVVNFGVFHPGLYFFQIGKSWDHSDVVTSGQLRINPGSQINQRIVCPKTPLDRAPVRVRVVWPADLEKERLVIFATFGHGPIQRDGQSWTLIDRSARSPSPPMWTGFQGPGGWYAERSVLCGPGTSMSEVLNSKALYIWGRNFGPDESQSTLSVWADLLTSDLREIKKPGESMSWALATYWLSELYVLRQDQSDGDNGRKREFEILVASNRSAATTRSTMHFALQFASREGPPTAAELAEGAAPVSFLPIRGRPVLALPHEYWSKMNSGFDVRKGQVNEWTIPLPDELIRAVRKTRR